MENNQKHRGLIFGYIAISVLAIAIIGMSISVWAKPYASAPDTNDRIGLKAVKNA